MTKSKKIIKRRGISNKVNYFKGYSFFRSKQFTMVLFMLILLANTIVLVVKP